jgi:hypothetical protein
VNKVGGGAGGASAAVVKLGRRGREAVEVISGLGPGEKVLMRTAPGKDPGAFRLGAS